MKINKNSGVVNKIFVSILLLIFGCGWFVIRRDTVTAFLSPKTLYDRGVRPSLNMNNVDEDDYFVIKLSDLEDLGVQSEEADYKLFLATQEDGYYWLDLKWNDTSLDKYIEEYNEYYTNGGLYQDAPEHYVVVNIVKDEYSELDELSEEVFANIPEELPYVFDTHYLVVVKSLWPFLMTVGFTLGAFVLGIATFILAIKRRKKNISNYEALFDLNPALKDNLSELDEIADYYNKKLGIYIYKDHFISTKNGLDMWHINDVKWLYQTNVRHKAYYFITVSTSYRLNICTIVDSKESVVQVELGSGKAVVEELENFFDHIINNYPHILVGFSDDIRLLYKNLKNMSS